MKKFLEKNWFKIIIALAIILVASSYYWYTDNKIKNDIFNKNIKCQQENPLYKYNDETNKCERIKIKISKGVCNFEIKDVKEYRGQYGKNQDNYIIYEGIIKNNSEKKEYLTAMIAKIYNENNLKISEGYTSIEKSIEPNESISFKINTLIDIHDTVKTKYFNESKELNYDIYPWFLTCN